MKKTTLYLDQFGQHVWARTRKELREQVPGRCVRMYADRDGMTFHIGYVIGNRWLEAYQRVERPA